MRFKPVRGSIGGPVPTDRPEGSATEERWRVDMINVLDFIVKRDTLV